MRFRWESQITGVSSELLTSAEAYLPKCSKYKYDTPRLFNGSHRKVIHDSAARYLRPEIHLRQTCELSIRFPDSETGVLVHIRKNWESFLELGPMRSQPGVNVIT